MAKKEKEMKTKKGHYFKDMKAELKKVIWPTPKQLINNTVAVIVFTLIIAVVVFLLDLCFNAINDYGIVKLQEKIQSSYTSTKSSEEGETNNEANENEASDENVEENSIGAEVNIENGDEKSNTEKEDSKENTDAGNNKEKDNNNEKK